MGRYDLSFKSLAEGSPLTLLRLFGHVPVDEATRFQALDRELAMSLKSVDHAFLLERAGQRWVEHFEAELVLSATDLRQILRRAALLAMRHEVEVWTTIVLLSRRDAPKQKPGLVEEQRGCVRMSMDPRIVELWEMSAELVLEDASVEVVPLVGGMKADQEEMERAMQRVAAVEDREKRSRLSAEMVTWSSLNYNERELAGIRARLGMVTMKDVMMASPIGEELVQYGRQEGWQYGRQEGRMEAARGLLIALLEQKFGSVPPGARQRIDSADGPTLERWTLRVLHSATVDEVLS